MQTLKFQWALRDAFDEEMARDDRVCLLGQDIGEYGGVFNTAKGLQKKYGVRRVFDTPLSEGAIIGTAVGAAASQLRPIAEIMYFDFITVGLDPVVNQAAKLHYMSGGQVQMPMVVISQFGSGTSEGAQHSQSLEAWFMHTPGLKVVMPSTVYDAKGLLKSSIRDNNPVVFLWHRMLYDRKEEVPDDEWIVPLGEAIVRREGTDLTLVSTSYIMHRALAAAEQLDGEVSIELIDPRTLAPLDIDTILRSVRKTGRLLVVHEANACCGVGAEIVRQVTQEAFDDLRSPPMVLGHVGVPMPFARVLEDACVPQEVDIFCAVRKSLESVATHPRGS